MSYELALAKVREAAAAGEQGPGPLSTGEKLLAALVLNRADWLARMDYTIVEAIERIGPTWMSYLPDIAKQLENERAGEAEAREVAAAATALAQLKAGAPGTRDDPLHFHTTLITVGSAPGYRDATLVVELEPLKSKSKFVARLALRPQDGEAIVRHIHEVHAFAWRTERGPLDKTEGEQRPRWIDARL